MTSGAQEGVAGGPRPNPTIQLPGPAGPEQRPGSDVHCDTAGAGRGWGRPLDSPERASTAAALTRAEKAGPPEPSIPGLEQPGHRTR
ncbi:hypothetical protein MC885_016986 [Smutsia gigantea]|nr:hypothetical protein MC885_016986 [Smutsia gigantea]